METVSGTAEIFQREISLNANLALSSTVDFIANEWAAGSAAIWPDGSVGVTGPTGSYDSDYYIKRSAQATLDAESVFGRGKLRATFYTGSMHYATDKTLVGIAVISAVDLNNV